MLRPTELDRDAAMTDGQVRAEDGTTRRLAMPENTSSSRAPDGSSQGADADLRGPAWVGTRIEAGARVPTAGTWEVVAHQDGGDCPGHGRLRALGRGDRAPACPRCDEAVTWQLSHLAVSAAAEHPDPGTDS
jgi:hypothetical protein